MDQGSNFVDITQKFMFVYVKIVIWGLKNYPGRVHNSILDTVPKVYQKILEITTNYQKIEKHNQQMSHFGGPLGAIGDMLGYDLSGYFRECF